ncbi:peptidyl-prolyl cis-trans isomerase [Microbulbifer sp.]|uniref:peptidylprolyl isomerase n=1 Tax=Microbulbifer sp. TaxID=1908541 RepID=UPI003F3F92D8
MIGKGQCRSLLIVLALAGCGEPPQEDPDVVVYVNNDPVRQTDLEVAIERTLGEQGALVADKATRDKVLESLVASRAIAGMMEAELTEKEKQALDAEVSAWRDERLVKRYLSERVNPQPVTTAMVEKYYREHPEEFGGGKRLHFEQLQVQIAGNDRLRDKAIALLSDAAKTDDWQALSATGRSDGLPVEYQKGQAGEGLTEPPLQARLRNLKPGEASALSFAGNAVSVVRLLGEENLSPRPLLEVSDDIRMRLAPLQLRRAVREVTERAVRESDIRYPGGHSAGASAETGAQ